MGPLESQPSVGSTSGGEQFVFWQGTDNNLWEAYFNDGKWIGSEKVGMGPLGSAPTVAVA
jgi:hypothetical protein